MKTVDTMSWFLRVDSISSMLFAGFKSVASRVVSRDTMMPEEVMSSGKDIAVHEWLAPRDDTDDTCTPSGTRHTSVRTRLVHTPDVFRALQRTGRKAC